MTSESFGHWTKVSSFRESQSLRFKGKTPPYVKKGKVPWNKGRKFLDERKKKMASFMRNSLNKCLRLSKTEKSSQTFDMLGFSPVELVKHIESMFQDGMSWENYGFRGWHIDHVKPISAFDVNEDPRKVNALSNLRPLWMHENLSKNSKWSE